VRILLDVPDLLFRSRLAASLSALGGAEPYRPGAECGAVVLLDLSAYEPEAAAARVAALTAAGARVIAFGPHRSTELLAQAKAAGAAVVSNRVLMDDPVAAVRRWTASDGT
jgi:hypothetical protein